MKPTGVANYYQAIADGDKLAEQSLVGAGQVRVFSVVFLPEINSGADADAGVQLKDGASGAVLYQSHYGPVAQATASQYSKRLSFRKFPDNGILFTEGVVAQGQGDGIRAISITYQGV